MEISLNTKTFDDNLFYLHENEILLDYKRSNIDQYHLTRLQNYHQIQTTRIKRNKEIHTSSFLRS